MHPLADLNQSKDYATTAYLQINSCGYLTNEDYKCGGNRPNGRKDYQLIYVHKGEMLFSTQNGAQILKAGTLYLYRPDIPQFYNTVSSNAGYYWIHFSGKEVSDMLDFFEKDYYYVGNLPEFENFCISLCVDIKTKINYNKLFYEGRFIALLGRISQLITHNEENKDYSKIKPAIYFMSKNYTMNCSNEIYAQKCGANIILCDFLRRLPGKLRKNSG